MSDPVNHHYLPIFYLSQWCGADGRLFRFHRPHKTIVCSDTTPKYTGYEPHLYRTGSENYQPEDRVWLETDYLSPKVDAPAATALQYLLKLKSYEALPCTVKQDWCRFIQSLLARSPEQVRRSKIVGEQCLKDELAARPEEYEGISSENDPCTLGDYVQQTRPECLSDVGLEILPDVIAFQSARKALMNMHWRVVDFSNAGVPLFTSDHPVIFPLGGILNKDGTCNGECILVMPLSPSRALFACHVQNKANSLALLSDDKTAAEINITVVRSATQNVYSSDCKDLEFVQSHWAAASGNCL